MAREHFFAPAGVEAGVLKPGDIILTHGDYFFSKLIRFGQAIRYGKTYSYWNHAALVLNEEGDLMEALSRGVVRTNIRNYKETPYHVISPPTHEHDREQMVAFAESVIEKKWKYDWLLIASLSVNLGFYAVGLPEPQIYIAKAGSAICSGAVCAARSKGDEIFDEHPYSMKPVQIFMHYEVEPKHG